MADLKTKPTGRSVSAFLKALTDDGQRRDCRALAAMMRRVTGAKPRMWGKGLVGFGEYHYRYASGHEGSWFLTGFAPRRGNLTVYVMSGFSDSRDLLRNLGRHRTGKSCLYIGSLSDIHLPTLEKLIRGSVRAMKARQDRKRG